MRSLNSAPKYVLLTFFLTLCTMAWGAVPTITVASPANGATVGAPTYFDATASTASCASGISAMRIYTAPGVNAFTTDSFHLETFLNLKAGTYNTVIQAWDNCGGVTKVSRTITVTAAAGVHVFLPTLGSSTTPVHFAASAESPGCVKGISALRIYPTQGANAYTIRGATLDAFIDLLPGNYNNVVVQAWDNCGNTFRAYLAILDTGGPNGQFLYMTDTEANNIAMYHIKNGVLSIPGGGSEPPTFDVEAAPHSVAVDPPGNFAYAGLDDGRVAVFEINRANGDLFLKQTIKGPSSGPAYLTVDRAGAFLFVAEFSSNKVASFRINRSSGLLTFIGEVATGNSPTSITTDFTGHFVYVANYNSMNISGYSLDANTGVLTSVAGSPFTAGSQPNPIAANGKFVYDIYNGGFLNGYGINPSGGSLKQVPGSPFDGPESSNIANSLQIDPFHNLLFYSAIGFTFGTDNISAWTIESNGVIQQSGTTTGIYSPSSIALDPSYQYVYLSQVNGYTGAPQVLSAQYSASNGGGTIISGPLNRPPATPTQLAVSQ